MAALTRCLSLVSRMSEDDQTDLIDRVDAYIAAGVAPSEAQRTAVQDILAELKAEREGVVGLVPKDVAANEPEVASEEAPSLSQAAEPKAGPGFYSALRREIANAKTNASPSEYWLNAIKGAVNKGAVKKDEVQWSGIEQWLGEQTGKIKKDDVLAWLDANGVKVEETVLGESDTSSDDFDEEIRQAEEASQWDLADRLRSDRRSENPAKYGQYVLPGGTNYREVLLTLPERQATAEVPDLIAQGWTVETTRGSEWTGQKEVVFRDKDGEWQGMRSGAPFNATDAELLADLAKSKANINLRESFKKINYKSGHWDQSNVVAHIRVNDRVDSTGARVMFVEELQSDGAQDKRRGKTDWKAPFIDSTDKWLGLALKRVIKMAADGGYDKVAFVTGEQSADRYSLDKQLDRLTYRVAGDSNYKIQAWDKNGSRVDIPPSLDAEGVEDYVGKDLAQKIVDTATREDQTLSGDGLKIEQKGMRSFYDQIVPAALKPLLKKMGGVMENVQLTGHADYKTLVRAGEATGLSQAELDRMPFAERKALVDSRLPGQPGFTLTPQMREQDDLPLFAQVQGSTWDDPEPTKWSTFVYELQNKQVDLRDATNRIRASGQTLSDRGDAYLRETLFAGRVDARIKELERNHILPLLTEMRAAGVSMADFGTYLHARHAEERNIEMQARNLNLPNNDALSGMSTPDARAILAGAKPVMARLAARVDAIIDADRNLMRISGIETDDMVTALENSYQHYVPLHRDEAHPDSRNGRGQGYSVKGSGVKRATGSNATVDPETILAHVLAQHETTIVRAEKNLVGMALLHMALTNPNPNWWKVDSPPTIGRIDDRQNVFNPGLGKMMPNPNYGQVRQVVDPLYKNQNNVVVVKVNGVDRSIVFNENNPRAARMSEALKNIDAAAMGDVLRVAAAGTRWMSAINTKYNPVFTIVNMVRDLQGAAINLTSTEINGAQAEILNPVRLAKLAREIYRYEQGKAPSDPAFGALYKEFRLRGGQTGWTRVYETIQDRAKDLEKAMTRKGKGGVLARGQAFVEFIGASNDAVENMIRVSAYKAAIDRGLSKDRAAALSKELTVNFNRRGAKTSQGASALYSFFNAAVQGNARLYQTITGKWGKAVVASGLMLGVAQALLLAAGLDDEEREAIQPWERKANFIIPLGDGKTMKIPMPLGLHVLPNIGRILTEGAMDVANDKPVNVAGKSFELVSTFLDALNPMGSGDNVVQMLTPTLVDPVVQIATNKGGLGGPVYRDRPENDAGAPGYTLGRDSTSPAWKALAYGIHWLGTGGDPYARNVDVPAWLSPQPEALRALPEAYLGGIWRETEKLLDTAAGLSKGEVDMNRALLISRFAGDLRSPTSPQQAFYRNLDKVSEEVRRKARMEKDGLDYDSPLADLKSDAGKARKEIGLLREDRREIALQDGDEEAIKAIELEIAEKMREFNDLVRAAR